MKKEQVIETLALQPHVEGGWFRRTYSADDRTPVMTPQGARLSLSCIYYLLTEDSPMGYWHRNRSDIIHFHQMGQPLTYHLIHPDGSLETVVLGTDLAAGQRLQLAVPGGTWKCSQLRSGEYGLVSEAVTPGFDYADMELADAAILSQQFPQHTDIIHQFTKPR